MEMKRISKYGDHKESYKHPRLKCHHDGGIFGHLSNEQLGQLFDNLADRTSPGPWHRSNYCGLAWPFP